MRRIIHWAPLALKLTLLTALSACSGSTEKTAATAQAFTGVSYSTFVNTNQTWMGSATCPTVTNIAPFSEVFWKPCTGSTFQTWAVYEPKAPGSYGNTQQVYLSITGNPATDPHDTMCMVPTCFGANCQSQPNTYRWAIDRCDDACFGSSGSCQSHPYSYAQVTGGTIKLNGNLCPSTAINNVGGQPSDTLVSTDLCNTLGAGAIEPVNFHTVFRLAASANGLPFYAQFSGGALGQPFDIVELRHRHRWGHPADGRTRAHPRLPARVFWWFQWGHPLHRGRRLDQRPV